MKKLAQVTNLLPTHFRAKLHALHPHTVSFTAIMDASSVCRIVLTEMTSKNGNLEQASSSTTKSFRDDSTLLDVSKIRWIFHGPVMDSHKSITEYNIYQRYLLQSSKKIEGVEDQTSVILWGM